MIFHVVEKVKDKIAILAVTEIDMEIIGTANITVSIGLGIKSQN